MVERLSAITCVIRTPTTLVFESSVGSIRVPTMTGQVGLRPRCEPTVFAFEPGLIWMRSGVVQHYAATAGGMLRCDGRMVTLLTSAVEVSDDLQDVLSRLERLLDVPSTEQEVRSMLNRIEESFRHELQGQGGRGWPGERGYP